MNGLYAHGMRSGAVVVHPTIHNAFDRFGRMTSSLGMMRRGNPTKFYNRGLGRARVGAVTPGPLGSVMDTLVGLIMDVAHVMLIIGGLFLLRQALVF